MTQKARTFRIFVSSTFSDLKAERNALQARVFPRLRDLAVAHGCRFQVIDLRWGVSEESSLDQQAMSICLGEIDRCQRASPRPNFIVLLGDRYGWLPPPARIPVKDFDRLLGVITDQNDLVLLKEWYLLDENADPPEWRLKPRERGSDFESYSGWQPVEARLQTILATATSDLRLLDPERLPYVASATEQEIAAGVLRVKEAPEHVLCFFRGIENLPKQFSAPGFQAMLAARLKEEYPQGVPACCNEVVKTLLGMEEKTAIQCFADCIHAALEKNLRATPEEECLQFIHQALVDYSARDFVNLDEHSWTIDPDAQAKQQALKKGLQAFLPNNVYTYPSRWTGEGITTGHLEQLCEDVYHALEKIILGEIEHPHEVISEEEATVHIPADPALDDEGLSHHRFAEERLQFFVGRTQMLEKIAAYLKDSRRKILANRHCWQGPSSKRTKHTRRRRLCTASSARPRPRQMGAACSTACAARSHAATR